MFSHETPIYKLGGFRVYTLPQAIDYLNYGVSLVIVDKLLCKPLLETPWAGFRVVAHLS